MPAARDAARLSFMQSRLTRSNVATTGSWKNASGTERRGKRAIARVCVPSDDGGMGFCLARGSWQLKRMYRGETSLFLRLFYLRTTHGAHPLGSMSLPNHTTGPRRAAVGERESYRPVGGFCLPYCRAAGVAATRAQDDAAQAISLPAPQSPDL